MSNLENEILENCFRLDKDLENNFGGWTGELVITGANCEIVHHERHAPIRLS